MAFVFDIETDGLKLPDITKIHVVSLYDTDTKQYKTFSKHQVPEAIKIMNNQKVIGHNVIKYDIPVIQKFFPEFKPSEVFDTLIVSNLLYPDIYQIDKFTKGLPRKLRGKQSLESWGYRLKILKGEFGKHTDWSTWSPEMAEYCEQDVRVTVSLYEYLLSKDLPWKAIELEQEVAKIIQRQEAYGFYFDVDKAKELYEELLERLHVVEEELQKAFPPKEVITGYYKRNNRKRNIKKGDPKITIEPFNPNSPKQRYERLHEKYGWKPSEFTPTGEPKTSEKVLSELKYPEIPLLLEYMMLSKRLGQLSDGNQGWLKNVGEDHRIHGSVRTIGAATGRMTHSKPNMAQVPAADDKTPYGYECRSLFTVPKGYKLVGMDAKGLELRCLAHYLVPYTGVDAEYIQKIIATDLPKDKDAHSYTKDILGLSERSQAKTFMYAFLYGAGPKLLGQAEDISKTKQLFLSDIQKINKGELEDLGVIKGLFHATQQIDPELYGTTDPNKWIEYVVETLNKYYLHLYEVTKKEVSAKKVVDGRTRRVPIHVTAKEALEICRGWVLRDTFYSKIPGLKKLQDDKAKEASESGRLSTFDDRKLMVRKKSAIFNYLLQSTGAIIMKLALVNLDRMLQDNGLVPGVDYEFVGNIHDEFQIEVKESLAEFVAKASEDAIAAVEANVPLAGEAKIGNNWAETH